MQSTETKKAGYSRKEPQSIAGLLLSALDMEDEIAHSVYQDYMDRKNWPASLKDGTFEEIQKHLTTLLNDTQRHRTMIKHLQSKLDRDNG
jgi:Mg2+ and Co2+ transporter CorA